MKQVLMALLGSIILVTVTPSFAGNCGDVNNSSTINALDVTYLINFLYKHGPAPNCGPETGTVTDIDSNIYQTVKIGNQWWMAENLKVTRYRNGDAISNVTDNATWMGLTTGAYCNYNNDPLCNANLFGHLYNWYAAGDSRNIAPIGWHVPSDAEWKQLEIHLGLSQAEADAILCRGTHNEGGKLKETGTAHWLDPNAGATNESGLSAIPAGYRFDYGEYWAVSIEAVFWTSTESDIYLAWYRILDRGTNQVCRDDIDGKGDGFSIRCVKD